MKPRFTKYWFKSYHHSNTLFDLAAEVGGKVLKLEGSKYRKKRGHILVNWGCSENDARKYDLNKPWAVRLAANKLLTFEALSQAEVKIPDYTESKDIANKWLDNCKVLGRDTATGRGGVGITVYKKGQVIDKDHLFYVKYYKKQREFRIHVFNDNVIFEQEKLKKKGVEDANKYIRSHDRGWCFAFNHLRDSPVPDCVREQATTAVYALGLDFGAVDIGWNDDAGTCVFEVNTAPGLEASSLQAYKKAIEHFYWEIIEGGPA